jgi:cell wall-associated NlpC family hydrolase
MIALAPLARGENGTYTVRGGDTLQAVAHLHQVPVDRLRDLNQLDANAALTVGQTLRVPAQAPVATYQVQPGDSLARVAQRVGTSPAQLAAANALTPDSVLQIGQKLNLPNGAGPGAVPVKTGPAAVPTPLAKAAPRAGEPARPAVVKPAVAKPTHVLVGAERINLRAAASMEAGVVRQIDPGTKLKIVGKTGSWWRVQVPGSAEAAFVAGWVVEPLLPGESGAKAEKPAAAAKALWVAEDCVNVRGGPSTDHERVAQVTRGDRLEVLESAGEWARVRCGQAVGWVLRSLTSVSQVARRASERGAQLVQAALGYVGVPYRRGGASREGVDCSGLVYAVCREAGIELPRSSGGMYGIGTNIERGNLRAGDLVFFKNTYRSGISHVGIYAGDNQFVHAVRPGRGVALTSLDDAYYAARWVGAYRVVD